MPQPSTLIDRSNHASIVHWDERYPDGKHIRENATLWNVVAGSAQIITDGVRTIPTYTGGPHGIALLTPSGTRGYSDANSWYDQLQARTAIGLSSENTTLYLFTVDRAGGSLGMRVAEMADLLIREYRVYNALNLDGRLDFAGNGESRHPRWRAGESLFRQTGRQSSRQQPAVFAGRVCRAALKSWISRIKGGFVSPKSWTAGRCGT